MDVGGGVITGNVSVGGVITGSVTTGGTIEGTVLAGSAGPQGPTGPTGPTGATGPAGTGIPAGGAVGALLTKQSITDYDTAWYNGPEINVSVYGAVGDGSTDDTAAIQAALNAASSGGIVSLNQGVYATTAPLVIPPGVTLKGTHASHTDNAESNWTAVLSWIQPKASFSGSGIIQLLDKTLASPNYALDSCEQRIFNVNIDGTNTTGSVNGIHAYGLVHGVVIRDVCIKNVPARGIYCESYTRPDTTVVNPYSWHVSRVLIDGPQSYGYSLNSMTDSFFLDCEVIGSFGTAGWFISGSGNTVFQNCRAEDGTGDGFYVDVGGHFNTISFIGCSTDYNAFNGLHITTSGGGSTPILVSSCMFHRDGANGGAGGGSYAGVYIDACPTPVIIEGTLVNTGVGDGGSGANSPQYGIRFAGSTYVQVNGGFYHGDTQGWHDSGSNTTIRRGPNVGEATGSYSSPTLVLQNDWGTDSGSNETKAMNGDDQIALTITNSGANLDSSLIDITTGSAVTDAILKSRISGDTNSRFIQQVNGEMSFGPGNAATDTNLYRSAAGVLKTDNTFVGAIEDNGGQVFNVKAYGAKGDNSTDDSTAIASAVSAAIAAGGGTVYLPPATYKVGTTITIDPSTLTNPLRVSGFGAEINYTGSSDAILIDSNIATSDIQHAERSVYIEGLHIVGTSSATSAIHNKASFTTMRHLVIENFTNITSQTAAIIMDARFDYWVEECHLDTIDMRNIGNGICWISQNDVSGVSASCQNNFYTNIHIWVNIASGNGVYGVGLGISGVVQIARSVFTGIIIHPMQNNVTCFNLQNCYASGTVFLAPGVDVFGTPTGLTAWDYTFNTTSDILTLIGPTVEGTVATAYTGGGAFNCVAGDQANPFLVDMLGNLTALTAKLNGSTSGSTILQPSAAASGTLTLPAATDTLVGKATTDILTNKTYDTAGTGNVFKINGTAISAVTGTGAVVLATEPTITQWVGINGVAGSARSIFYTSSSSNRIELQLTNTSESGSNAGSDFAINTYTDAGAYLNTSLLISRSTGILNLYQGLALADNVNISSGTSTGTKIGTSTSQKLGFYNATPIVQPTGDIKTALGNLGLVGSATLAASDITAGALASGMTATTQGVNDNSTKLATTAYADRNLYLPSVISFKEDFTEGSSVSLTTSQTYAAEQNWHIVQISTGTQTVAAQAGSFTSPGQVIFTTAATSGNGVSMWRSGPGSSVASLGVLGSNANWELHFRAALSQTTLCAMRLGVCIAGQNAGDQPTSGFWIEYDTANTGNSDTDFTWVTNNAGTKTYSTTNAIAADTNFHHFRIRSTSAGTILFSVDGGTETSIATNITTAAVGIFMQGLTRTAAAKSIVIDFVSYIGSTGRT